MWIGKEAQRRRSPLNFFTHYLTTAHPPFSPSSPHAGLIPFASWEESAIEGVLFQLYSSSPTAKDLLDTVLKSLQNTSLGDV